MIEWPHLAKHLPRGKPPSAPGTVWMILPCARRVTDHLLSVAGQSFSWRAASTGGSCQDRMTRSARSTDTRWTSTLMAPGSSSKGWRWPPREDCRSGCQGPSSERRLGLCDALAPAHDRRRV